MLLQMDFGTVETHTPLETPFVGAAQPPPPPLSGWANLTENRESNRNNREPKPSSSVPISQEPNLLGSFGSVPRLTEEPSHSAQ